jgi:hypothetical protein
MPVGQYHLLWSYRPSPLVAPDREREQLQEFREIFDLRCFTNYRFFIFYFVRGQGLYSPLVNAALNSFLEKIRYIFPKFTKNNYIIFCVNFGKMYRIFPKTSKAALTRGD